MMKFMMMLMLMVVFTMMIKVMIMLRWCYDDGYDYGGYHGSVISKSADEEIDWWPMWVVFVMTLRIEKLTIETLLTFKELVINAIIMRFAWLLLSCVYVILIYYIVMVCFKGNLPYICLCLCLLFDILNNDHIMNYMWADEVADVLEAW